jgi:thiamine biosynthesis lipoprotein
MLHEHRFRAMDTDVGVWLWSTAPEHASRVRQLLDWAQTCFGRVESELSRFRGTSGISRLNQAAGRGPQPVSPLLWTVLMSALDASNDSGGIYDPAQLRTLERMGYDRSFAAIGGAPVRRTSAPVPSWGSWRRVALDRAAHAVSLPADLALDFGGIAKGWTIDRVARGLAPLGPVLVDAGGDLRAIGTVDGEAWPIAVQDPFEPERDRAIVRLSDGALATSSIGGRRWRCGDAVLHHAIDPRTGTAARSGLHSVTVWAPTAMRADVAAKVVLVLGAAAGATYLLERGLSGWLTSEQGAETEVGKSRVEPMGRHAPLPSA